MQQARLERDAKKWIPVFRKNPALKYSNRSRFMILGRLDPKFIDLEPYSLQGESEKALDWRKSSDPFSLKTRRDFGSTRCNIIVVESPVLG
ncbi:MAG: hypothetical protein FWC84_00805, partial [Alphaproteobacteria bacterium]|nr:hypothetical protein [Alphaproteobacteria bacterium]